MLSLFQPRFYRFAQTDVQLLGAALDGDAKASGDHDQVLLYPTSTFTLKDASLPFASTRKGLDFESYDEAGGSSQSNSEGSRVVQVWNWVHKRSRGQSNGGEEHTWYFVVDGAKALHHVRSKSVSPWKKLHGRVATLSEHFDPAVPVYLGDQYFHPGLAARTSPGFPATDAEDWLPICKVDHVLLNTGFLDLIFGSPFDTAGTPCSDLEFSSSRNGSRKDGLVAESLGVLASCVDEHHGLRCRSLSSWIKRALQNTAAKGVDEWGPTWRHSAWNCSVSAGPDEEPVSAVCQAPLKRKSEHPDPSKLATAPEWIADLYKVVHTPKPTQAAASSLSGNPNGSVSRRGSAPPQSWLASSSGNGAAGKEDGDTYTLPPVSHREDEPRDAVLAVGSGETLNPVPIEFFVKTLRSTGCRAEIVLFLDNRRVLDYVGMAEKYGGIRLISIETEVLNKKFKYGKPSVLFRFALYLHFMALPGSSLYRRCLHADLFDTYFQRDPFAVVDMRGGLAVFAENTYIRIGHCSFHRYWYNGCQQAGKLLSRAHAELRICMGVVMGMHAAFLNFLKMTLFYVMQRCNDQGVLNMLTHSGKFAEVMPVTIFTSQDGVVLHLNTDWHVSINADGIVRNGIGKPFAVVHQYDRIGKLNPTSDDGSNVQLISSLVGASKETFAKRETGLRQKWLGGEKHDWSKTGRVAASCTVVGSAEQHQEVLCHANSDAKERKKGSVLFCPTHSPVTVFGHEKVAAWFGGDIADSAPESSATTPNSDQSSHHERTIEKILKVATSPYLTCTSQEIVSKCSNQHWCPVSKKIVAAAVHACNEHRPSGADDNELISQVTYNIVFRCLNPSVASRHREANELAEQYEMLNNFHKLQSLMKWMPK